MRPVSLFYSVGSVVLPKVELLAVDQFLRVTRESVSTDSPQHSGRQAHCLSARTFTAAWPIAVRKSELCTISRKNSACG